MIATKKENNRFHAAAMGVTIEEHTLLEMLLAPLGGVLTVSDDELSLWEAAKSREFNALILAQKTYGSDPGAYAWLLKAACPHARVILIFDSPDHGPARDLSELPGVFVLKRPFEAAALAECLGISLTPALVDEREGAQFAERFSAPWVR
ncbi:MAG: hypothetical protein GC154_09805 [bacterium]|nr:hypothetical protein [bacterium]